MAITKYKTADNKTRYQVRVYYKGKRYGGKSFESKQVAQTWERQKLVELESKGVFTNTDEAHNTTLKDCVLRYKKNVAVHKKGYSSEKGKLNNIANSELACKSLANIQRNDIGAYRDQLLSSGYAAATVKQYLALLSRIYTYIVYEWEIKGVAHVVKRVARPKVDNARERRLIGDEEQRLLEHSAGHFLHNAIVIALETGMRQGEIAALEWQNIDLEKRHLYVRKSKSGKKRTVRLSLRVLAILKAMKLNDNERVFTKSANEISKEFTAAVRELDIKNLHFHDLRHEATSRFFEKGLNIKQVQQMTGHETLEMLFRYVHLSPDNDFVHLLD